jgi:hypothetical protein
MNFFDTGSLDSLNPPLISMNSFKRIIFSYASEIIFCIGFLAFFAFQGIVRFLIRAQFPDLCLN